MLLETNEQIWKEPCIASYEAEKSLRVINDRHTRTTVAACRESEGFSRRFAELWQPRFAAAAGKISPLAAPSLYPGPKAPAEAGGTRLIDRGNLALERYSFLRSRGMLPEASADSIAEIKCGGEGELQYCLERVRSLWGAPLVRYEESILCVVMEYLRSAGRSRAPVIPLGLLFEIEYFAAYETYLHGKSLLCSGFFRSIWIDVVSLPPHRLRQSEECEPKRVLHELKNLRLGRVAPVVLNEYDCVADGNHRLTAAHLQNFSVRGESYLNELPAATQNSVRSHAARIGNGEVQAAAVASSLPVVPLFEYFHGTVYNRSLGEFHSHPFPQLEYLRLITDPTALFPARQPYHFTDVVPLPWFDVLSPLQARPGLHPGS